MNTFTADQLEEKVRSLAEHWPVARYKQPPDGTCAYDVGTVENGPAREGCIFGQAITALLGVPINVRAGIAVVLRSLYIKFEADNNHQATWFGDVQRAQDSGKTWSDAIAVADECKNNRGA